MRENLIGYLLGALDDTEVREIEAMLAGPGRSGDARMAFLTTVPAASAGDPATAVGESAALRQDLEILRRAMTPLERDADLLAAPQGLASRTIDLIRKSNLRDSPLRDDGRREAATISVPFPRASLSPATDAPRAGTNGRRTLDRVLIAATALAASILLAPLLLDSIEQARSRRAERNLGVVSQALHGYASHHRIFPSPPASGPLSRAGLYAPILVSEERLVADDGTVILPGTPLAKSGRYRVPSLKELEAAIGTEQFEEMVRMMGGDFGYTLGHRCPEGDLQTIRDRRRAEHPIMADAPDDRGRASSNHPGGLHHVLFEDGRVRRLFIDQIGGHDHIYHNHHGVVAAGVCEDDAAIGASHHKP